MIISKKSLIPFMTIGSIASGCCLYWQYHSNIDLSDANKHSVVGFMVANPTSGSRLTIQHKGSSSAAASSTTTTNAPSASPVFNAPDINPSSPITTTPASPSIMQKPSPLPQVSSSPAPIPVSSSLNSANTFSSNAILPITNNDAQITPSQSVDATLTKETQAPIQQTSTTKQPLQKLTNTLQPIPESTTGIFAPTHIVSPQTPLLPIKADVRNPCSADCYKSKVVPILKNFISGNLNEEEIVKQIKETTKTNKDQEFNQKVQDSIALAKKYITLKKEINETTKQINEIQNTNSILSGELSSGKVKKTEQIEKIQQKTAEVNAIQFTPIRFTCAVGIRTTAATNHTTHLQTCLGTAIHKLERQQRGQWGLTKQDAKNLQNFKYNLNALNRKAWVNTEIQNMTNNLREIEKIITKKSNMIAANKVKIQSNENENKLKFINQAQILEKLELCL